MSINNAHYGTVNLNNNYMDPTGAFLCFVQTAGGTFVTLNMSGNINLTDGSTISDFSALNCHGHH